MFLCKTHFVHQPQTTGPVWSTVSASFTSTLKRMIFLQKAIISRSCTYSGPYLPWYIYICLLHNCQWQDDIRRYFLKIMYNICSAITFVPPCIYILQSHLWLHLISYLKIKQNTEPVYLTNGRNNKTSFNGKEIRMSLFYLICETEKLLIYAKLFCFYDTNLNSETP